MRITSAGMSSTKTLRRSPDFNSCVPMTRSIFLFNLVLSMGPMADIAWFGDCRFSLLGRHSCLTASRRRRRNLATTPAACSKAMKTTIPWPVCNTIRVTLDDSIVGLPQQMTSWEAFRKQVRGFRMLIEFYLANECGTLFAFAGVCRFSGRILSQNGNFECHLCDSAR